MNLKLSKPILYLITPGATSDSSGPDSPELRQVLAQVSAAVIAGIPLIQLREKALSARVLFDLTQRAVGLARGSISKILVNDRADIARAAGAAGVHLTTQSLTAATVRKTFGADFLIGVSTHSLKELSEARDEGADFAVYGPVFGTASKEKYGAPVGLKQLARACNELTPFPVLALGGITIENAAACLEVCAHGIAGIKLFSDSERLSETVNTITVSARGAAK